jgi:hypothetical protein
MKAWRAILVAAVVGAAVLLVVHTDTTDQPQVTVAGKYAQLVNELYIPKRWLRLEERAGQPELVWVPPEDEQQRKPAEQYLQRSYLSEDVERFNNPRSVSDRLLFAINQGRLQVNPDAHVFVSPFQQRGRWMGNLYYSGTARPTNLLLQSLDVEPLQIEMRPLAKPFTQARAEAVDVAVFGARRESAGSASMVRFLDRRGREVALAWRIGNGMAIQLKADEGETALRVRINGRRILDGRNSIHHLPRRAVLLFENEKRDAQGSPQRRAWVVREAQDPNLIYDARSDVWHGGTENPLLVRVVEALGNAARVTEAPVEQSVTLTLARAAEQAAAEVLRATVAKVRTGKSAVGEARAAITLMDGLNGALLALPSWPESAIPIDPVLEKLPENHNFTRLAPGSVVKVLYSAALLETHKELMTLEVNVLPESFPSVAGIALDPPVGEDGVPGTLNFSKAIAYSANRYAATLLTLASDDPDGGGQRTAITEPADFFILNGITQDRRPANLLFEPGRESILVADLDWAQRMRELYEINISSARLSDNPYRRYVWEGLPRAFRIFGASAALLDSIAPPTENLQLDRIDARDFRTRFLPLILGGGESRWSNIALAEAFASIVADRRVRAHLVAGAEPAPRAGIVGLDPEVRKALLTGINGVIKFGTGSKVLGGVRRDLARAACLQRGRGFELFGKTGTPELENYVLAPGAAVFNQMAKDGLFVREPGSGRIAYTGFGTDPVERKDLRVLRAAAKKQDSLIAQHFQKYFRSKLVHAKCGRRSAQRVWEDVFVGIVLDNNDKLERGYQTVRGEGGILFSDRSCLNKSAGKNLFGKHFVFVAALYDQIPEAGGNPGRCDGKLPEVDITSVPSEAITGVVAVEHVSPGQERVALEAAARLLLGPVAQQLGLRVVPRAASKTAGAGSGEESASGEGPASGAGP